MSRFAHLNLFVAGRGYHEASWRIPSAPPGPLGLQDYVDIAREAERGVLDSIFLADSPGVALFRTRFMVQSGFDPIDVLAALTPVTSHIGLLATASTTYGTPWDIARRFATLDHLSGGRAGWNIVTTGNPVAAANFGDRPHAPHDDRYRRAQEFVEVVRQVWDGWDDDAVIAEAASGEWADQTKLHPPHHHGEHFSVDGILPFPRSPQGHPVLVQAGSSPQGIDLAGRFADLVFTPRATIEEGIAFRRRIREVAVSHGRSADDIRTLPGLSFVLGSTEREAQQAWLDLQAASSPEFRRYNLAHLAGADLEAVESVDPDGPFPYGLFEEAASTTFAGVVMNTARGGGLTFRQAADRFATLPGGLHVSGTPEQLADVIEKWWRAGAADGVTLQPLRLPLDVALFVEHVSPLLQVRGVSRPEYSDGTLREQLSLSRPVDHAHRRAAGSGVDPPGEGELDRRLDRRDLHAARRVRRRARGRVTRQRSDERTEPVLVIGSLTDWLVGILASLATLFLTLTGIRYLTAVAAFDKVIGLELGDVALDGSLHKAQLAERGNGQEPDGRIEARMEVVDPQCATNIKGGSRVGESVLEMVFCQ